MAASLDTNLLLRLVLGDVPEQYVVVRDLITAPGAHYRISSAAIAEMVHALLHHYHFTREQVGTVVHTVLLEPAFDIDRSHIEKTLEAFLKHKALSYMDCFLAEEARVRSDTPLLTFDKDLSRLHTSAQLPK